MVSKTQNAKLDERKLLGSDAVVVQGIGLLVLSAIQLEREASFSTIEIQHESAYCVLSPKLETQKGSPSQACPEQQLSCCGGTAQLTGDALNAG